MLSWITWALIITLISLAAVVLSVTIGIKYPVVQHQNPNADNIYVYMADTYFSTPLPGQALFQAIDEENAIIHLNPIDYNGLDSTNFLETFQIGGTITYQQSTTSPKYTITAINNLLPTEFQAEVSQPAVSVPGKGPYEDPLFQLVYEGP